MKARFRPGFSIVRSVLLLGVAVVALAGCARQDLSDLQRFVEKTKRETPIKKPDPPPETKPYTPFTYTAQGVKDPFLVAPFAQEEELEMTREVMARSGGYSGVRPDPNRVREELEKYSLGSLKMKGTFRVGGGNELWALVLAPDGVVHRVQKNNYLGTNHGKILNITEQRVDLKEIVPDGPGRWQERDAFLSLTQ
ncbi:MAG TPA: pilus assembly protein PilP [Candidatus Competibacter sp.]|jgi:type IV pilus assembly protein PilP|nr:pilus assembly protein PilP [Candidatus Competibacter sp.]HUM90196.1 pilus assembly protein PilP [Candidatus Competibacter sp.]